MCWEEQCIILSQTISKWSLGQDVSLSFLYRFCKLWWILTDLRTKEIYQVPSFISTRLQDEKGWCLGGKHLFKDGGDCSEEPIPVSSSSLELCPSYLPLWALGFMLRVYIPLFPSGILSELWLGSWGRISTQCWAKMTFFGQTSQTRADSGNSSVLVFFQVWDTISCPCFCKISASNHTMCNPMGTALKGTCKGQHSQYMALLKGQVCVASSYIVIFKIVIFKS